MRRRSIGKPTLLAGCALGAWLAIAPSAAAAQGFQGNGTVVTGDATITPGAGSTSILLSSNETVINWTPFDTSGTDTVDFLPAGNTALFRSGFQNFTVLNRVIPVNGAGAPAARAISLNGTVASIISDPVTFNRGSVWFYSPTGIVVGPTAIMSVGSLILTTNDISFVPNDPVSGAFGSIYGPGGLVEFRGPADSAGFVEVQSGAQLIAAGPNAYLALVAPRVVQGGAVGVDGQIAYIAAEQVDMRINAGLFDFTLLVGTTDEDGIVHTGTSTGPASTSVLDTQRISMVAMPKNDALTMLLSGSIGYTPAASAAEEGSSIVLSAGFDTPDPSTFSGADDSSIRIGPATFRNTLDAWATDRINVLPQGGTTRFGGRTSLNAGGTVEFDVIEREFVIADSDLFLTAGRPGIGGTVDLFARTFDGLPGGVIDVAGRLAAGVHGAGILPGVEPLDAEGGTITIDANGGTIEASDLYATADAFARFDAAQGGTGTGGTIDIVARNSGTITAQSVDLFASGYGGNSDGIGGDGFGGAITVRDLGGTLGFGSVFLGAHGGGGDSELLAGNGTSGTAAVTIGGQAQDWTNLSIGAGAGPGISVLGSEGLTGSATGRADAASLTITGPGALTLTSGLSLTATAGMYVNGQPGFTGEAGGVNLAVINGGELTVTGTIYAHASALFGGEGIFFDPDTTPTMQGGQVSVTADGGNITAYALDVGANAYDLPGTIAAGNATGGTVTVSALNGGRILLDDSTGTSLLSLTANGLGAPGPNPSHSFGGTAQLIAEDGSITVFGDIEISASGLIGELRDPPPAGPGHDATGGTASVELRAGSFGTANLQANSLTINAIGDSRLILTSGTLGPGGDPIQGDGGDGTGGTAGLTVVAGSLTIDDLTLDSSGIGGGSGVSGGATALVSGSGFGGTSQFAVSGGISNITTLDILSNGTGGDGTAGSPAAGSELATIAGEGTGGGASLQLSGNGTLRVTDATLAAIGFGAQGMDHIGDGDATDGGIGTGGSAALSSAAGWAGSIETATLALRGNGIGGMGGLSAGASEIPPTGVNGDGGAGFGGSATIDFADGQFALGTVTIEATGTGGDSGDASSGLPGAEGGYGTGGSARLALIDSPAGPLGLRDISNLQIDASGFGGLGSFFAALSATGEVDLTVSVLDPASALSLPGSLSVYAGGSDPTATGGIRTLISGAPLQVGSDVTMSSGAPIAITATQPLRAGTFLTLDGYSVTTTNLIQSGNQMFVSGLFGVTADRLTSGDTTTLNAAFGPVVVGDLLSADLVTASGQSVDIRSSAGLTFASADATGGDLYIGTVGDLDVASLSAAGSATLETSAGNISTDDFTAGSFIYVDSFGSADLGNIVAGTDAAVTTRSGNLTVGNVTAGDEIWLSVFGTDATRVLTAGNLVTTGLGADDAAGPGELFGDTPNGAGPTGNVSRLRSSGSLVVGDMQSPGRAILVADAGTTSAGALSADEALIVLGRGNISLDSIATEGRFYVADSAMFLPNLPDAYDPASLNGLTPLRTGGGLTVGSAVEAGDITVAVAGTATAPSWTSAGGLFIDSGGLFTSSVAVSAGGNASITADNGIDLTALTAGGTTVLRSPLGAVDVGNLLSTGAVTARGRSVDIASGGALSFADLDGTAGNLVVATTGNLTLATADATGTTTLSSSTGSIAATGAVVSGGAVSASGPAGVSFASLTSGGTTLLQASGGAVDVDQLLSTGAVTARGRSVDVRSTGALTFADLDATEGNLVVATGGNLALATADASGTATLSSSTGSIEATGAVNSGGAFSATAPAGVTFASLVSGGTTLLTSTDGPIDVNSLVSPGLVSATGRGVFINGSGPLSFATAVSTGQMAITASGNLAFASVDSALDLTLTSTTGSITATGNVRGGFPNLTAAGNVLIEGDLNSLGTLVVNAGGSFTVEGDTGADDAQITADQGITMASLQTGEITRLDAPNGNILIPELLTGGRVTARGLDVNITSSGGLLFDEVRASSEDVRITVVDNLIIGEAFSTDEIVLDAGGTFTLAGTARGLTIDVTSSDIELGGQSRLGLRDGTRDITLRNGDAETETFIGGAARDGEYSLTQSEAARMSADESITILADSNITIDDLALSFGAGGTNIGTGGMLEISSPNDILVIGDVALRTSGPDDTFRIDPRLIALDTDTGSISMFTGEGSGGTPLGRLELVGGRIVAATGANIAQLESMTDLDAINRLLGQPGGTGEPLSAGTIHIDAADALFIQNSGASDVFADRRGFAASGLEIVTGSAATQIAINGRILTPGGAATGLATTPLVSINGVPAATGGQFHVLSTINGCVIGRNCAPTQGSGPPTREDIENPVAPGEDPGSLFAAPLIELAGTEPLITPPLVDEPITGVGNDDLWEPRCEPGEEGGACPEDDGQP